MLESVLSAALASIASQGFELLIGAKDKFFWKNVALGALGGVINAGLPTDFAKGLGKWGQLAAKAALSNALTQGIAVTTGLQPKFDWKAVATSAIAAPLGQALGDSLLGTQYDSQGKVSGHEDTSFTRFLSPMGAQFTQAVADVLVGTVRQGIRMAVYGKGKLDFASIAADAFGSALGNSVMSDISHYQQAKAQAAMSEPGSGFGLRATPKNWAAFNEGLTHTINANEQARQGTAPEGNSWAQPPIEADDGGFGDMSLWPQVAANGGGRSSWKEQWEAANARRKALAFDRFKKSEISAGNAMARPSSQHPTDTSLNSSVRTTYGEFDIEGNGIQQGRAFEKPFQPGKALLGAGMAAANGLLEPLSWVINGASTLGGMDSVGVDFSLKPKDEAHLLGYDLFNTAALATGVMGLRNAFSLRAVGGNSERLLGARGGRVEFGVDPAASGGPLRELSNANIKITDRGIDVVERHISRFGSDAANDLMVGRLRGIASGKVEATVPDYNFYAHELREFTRVRRLGFETGTLPNEVYYNAHSAALREYGIFPIKGQELRPLYHPDAIRLIEGGK